MTLRLLRYLPFCPLAFQAIRLHVSLLFVNFSSKNEKEKLKISNHFSTPCDNQHFDTIFWYLISSVDNFTASSINFHSMAILHQIDLDTNFSWFHQFEEEKKRKWNRGRAINDPRCEIKNTINHYLCHINMGLTPLLRLADCPMSTCIELHMYIWSYV